MLVQQHATADDSVEQTVAHVILKVTCVELHVTEFFSGSAAACHLQRGFIQIDTNDLTAGRDHARRQQGDIADTASHIEYPHTGAQTGFFQEMSCDLRNQAPLPVQAIMLGMGSAEHIFGLFQYRRCHSGRSSALNRGLSPAGKSDGAPLSYNECLTTN
jgi:hypothetical protein